ncbi:cytochrome P450 family protein [Catellatospora methionotrophica]|uniref:cytochrome P450 family protein n=1 Tax=Catellatospora methionotrophica TaxID=121620 RepID=UPI0033F90A8F
MEEQCPVVIDRTGRDIHQENSRLRALGPIARVELPGGMPAWSVTGYEAVRQALADPRLSKDARRHWTAFAAGAVGPDFPLLSWALMDNLATAHGEDHARLRRLVMRGFSGGRVEAMRPSIERIVDRLLDELAGLAAGAVVDIRTSFAQPLVTEVVCELIGVPAGFRDEMLRGGEVNVTTTITPEQAAANVARWRGAMQDFVEAKRRLPGDDLTTDLIAAQEAGGARLTDAEIINTLHFLRAAGTVPTMNLLGNTVFALLTRPDQRELVLTGQVTWDDVIEESLRAEAPVAHLPFRFPVDDVEICGVAMKKGEPVLINYAAAGRDPGLHGEDAERFDITRQSKENLAFGYGIHRCIGVALARLEVRIALSSLFARFPHLRLGVPAEQVEPQESFIMNGKQAVPVLLRPSAG